MLSGARDLSVDGVNRLAWRRTDTVRLFSRLKNWTDPGEQAAIEYVAQEAAGQPILDMGVGGGRTTSLLLPLSRNYTGIDYTGEMVDACRKRHPGVWFERMDARDMSRFQPGIFALAVFSFNGIDSMDFADRQKVLRGVHRVLRPGGLFVFSAHNRDGPGLGEKPGLHLAWSANPVKLAWRVARALWSLPAALRNYRRFRDLKQSRDGWTLMNCAAHDFAVVAMYTTYEEQIQQLKDCGFETELVVSNLSDRPVVSGRNTDAFWWMHYVARKPWGTQ